MALPEPVTIALTELATKLGGLLVDDAVAILKDAITAAEQRARTAAGDAIDVIGDDVENMRFPK